jgi:trigger factor
MSDTPKSQLTREPDGSVKLVITLPQEDVARTRNAFIDAAVTGAEVPGFRKGKAPRDVVEKRLDEGAVQEEVLKQLLPKAYVAAVEEHGLKPIMNPKIHVHKIEADKDWTFEAVTCEAPAITIGDYKKKVQDITAKSKIIVPVALSLER